MEGLFSDEINLSGEPCEATTLALVQTLPTLRTTNENKGYIPTYILPL